TVGAAAKTIWDTRPVSQAEVATARAQALTAAADPSVRAELKQCRAHPADYLGAGATARGCERLLLPSARSMLLRQELSVADELAGEAVPLTVMLAGVVVIVAATYAGADWRSDSLSTQLTFESRRHR